MELGYWDLKKQNFFLSFDAAAKHNLGRKLNGRQFP